MQLIILFTCLSCILIAKSILTIMKKNIRLFAFLAFTALIISACVTKEKEEGLDMEKV
ncbi:MAG: NADH:ubiquinone oxidoreductase subunit 6 (subunit J), partial [Candidatus Azotimanducaceae bacterium]